MSRAFRDWREIEVYSESEAGDECADFPDIKEYTGLPRWIQIRQLETGQSVVVGAKRSQRRPEVTGVQVAPNVIAALCPGATTGAHEVTRVKFRRAGPAQLFVFGPGIYLSSAAAAVLAAAAIAGAVAAFASDKRPLAAGLVLIGLASAAALIKLAGTVRAAITPNC